MELGQCIAYLFPVAKSGVDYIVRDDSDGKGAYIDVWNLANPKPAQADLDIAWLNIVKQTKIQEVTNAYTTQLNSTFTSSATGAALVYDYSPESQILWKELKDTIGKAVDGGDVPDSILFPNNGTRDITLADKTAVPHTRTQLQQVIQDAIVRKLQLYAKLQGMDTANGSIMSATKISDVQVIAW